VSSAAESLRLLSDLARTLVGGEGVAAALEHLCRDDRIRGAVLLLFHPHAEVVAASAGRAAAPEQVRRRWLREVAERAVPGTVLQVGRPVAEGQRHTRELAAPVARGGRVAGVLLARVAEGAEERSGAVELVRVAAAMVLHGVTSIPDATGPLTERVAAYERGLIEEALAATRGRRAEAARRLQVTERILRYRIDRYGIDHTRFRG
jgi:DNA-binding NtrC family response regulator